MRFSYLFLYILYAMQGLKLAINVLKEYFKKEKC
jgi:hypothetical protein